MITNKTNFLSFIFIFFVSFSLLIFVAIPSLNGSIELKFYFDSLTYLRKATEFSKIEAIDLNLLIEMAITNSFGPVILGSITNNNPFLIWFFNFLIYWNCSSYIINKFKLNPKKYHMFVFINLISWISLVTLNKEIFSFLSITLLLSYLKKKNLIKLIFLIISGFLVRWQMVLFLVTVIFTASHIMPFKNKRSFHIIGLLLLLSLTLPLYTLDIRESIEWWREQTLNNRGSGSGLYLYWIQMDTKFLYFLSFPLKLIHLTILNFIQFVLHPSINLSYFHNTAETAQSFSFIILYFNILRNKQFRTLSNDFTYISLIYLIIFVTVQIYTPRYLFPGYLLLAIMLSSKPIDFLNPQFHYNKITKNTNI